MSSKEFEVVERYFKLLNSTMAELRSEISVTRKTLESLVKISNSINENIVKTRADLAARIHLASIVVALLDYVRVTSRLEALKKVETYIREKLTEVKTLYIVKFKEIIKDYVIAINDFFTHFVKRARGDFDLIRGVLRKEKDVEDLYEKLKPGYIDSELVKLALENDTIERMRDAKRIFEVLTEASSLLESASRLEEDLRKLLAKYEVNLPGEAMLLFPVIGVEAQLDGSKLIRTVGPTKNWEEMSEFSRRAARYAEDFIRNYPVNVAPEVLNRVKILLMNLAKEEDERKLIERMELVV